MCALPRAVIFDLDGVLLDTEPLYTAATQAVVGEFGKTYSVAQKSRIMGCSARRSAEYVVRELHLPISPAEYLKRRRSILERLFQDTSPVSGAIALVTKLHGLGLPLGIATSSERSLFDLKAGLHDWFCLFAVVVCGDDPDLIHPKPAPDIFHLAARRLGLEARHCVIFEDSPAGVTAAVASGARVIARHDPILPVEALSSAHLIVDGYDALSVPSCLDGDKGVEPRPSTSDGRRIAAR